MGDETSLYDIFTFACLLLKWSAHVVFMHTYMRDISSSWQMEWGIGSGRARSWAT